MDNLHNVMSVRPLFFVFFCLCLHLDRPRFYINKLRDYIVISRLKSAILLYFWLVICNGIFFFFIQVTKPKDWLIKAIAQQISFWESRPRDSPMTRETRPRCFSLFWHNSRRRSVAQWSFLSCGRHPLWESLSMGSIKDQSIPITKNR